MFIIGMVNYKTSDLIETQFSIYRDFAGASYKIVLLDTSGYDEEYQALLNTSKCFNIPIQIFRYSPIRTDGSGAHGESLQHLYKLICESEPSAQYFLTQDPDFFWVKRNFLAHLEERLLQYEVVGAPYSIEKMKTLGSIRPDFPAAFGAVYKMSTLHSIGADFQADGLDTVAKDVGWQIRNNFGSRTYFSFNQTKLLLAQTVGLVSRENISCTYFDEDKVIAHHLYRCSMSKNPCSGSFKHPDRAEWQKNRKLMCEKFWKEINEHD